MPARAAEPSQASSDRYAPITVITPDSGATWRGSHVSFHLRRVLKGDRLRPAGQADGRWGGTGSAGVMRMGELGDASTETHMCREKKANDFGGMIDGTRNERLMAHNGC